MSINKIAALIDPGEWITQAEAARLRSVSRQAIGRLVLNNRLRTIKIGGRTLINRSDLLEFRPNPAGRPKNTSDG